MDSPVFFLQLVINGALFWGLLLALGTLFRPSPDRSVSLTFAAFAAAQSLSLLPITFSSYSIQFASPLVNALISMAPLLIGPCYYLYFSTAFGLKGDLRERMKKHFALLPVFFIVIVLMYRYPRFFGSTGSVLTLEEVYRVKRAFIAFQFFHILMYYGLTIKTLMQGIKKKRYGEEVKSMKLGVLFTLAYFSAISFAFVAVVFFGKVFPRVQVMSAFACMMLIISIQYLVSQRYPLLMAFSSEKKKIYSEDEPAVVIDYFEIEKQLMGKMLNEKIYRSEDLTISMVAHELEIRPWQLSQFLNGHLNVNFNTFVNTYRVKEARHLLTHEPEKNILTIAFEVGFNSKSSFNRVFQKYTHLTPSEYRRLFRDIQEGY